MNHNSLDIVLPCYNPAPNWTQVIITTFKELSKKLPHIAITLIIVNDGSKKGLQKQDIELLHTEIPCFQYVEYHENKGKGYALRKGVEKSQSTYCIYSDIDFPYTTPSIIDIFTKLSDNTVDVVVGSRGAAYYEEVPNIRIFISKLLRLFNKTFLGMEIYDTQCGLKGFNKKGREEFLKTTIERYLFDLEFVYLVSNNKTLTIVPINVTLKEGIIFSKMNFKILRQEGWAFIKLVFGHFFTKR